MAAQSRRLRKRTASLKSIRCLAFNQWSWRRSGVMWPNLWRVDESSCCILNRPEPPKKVLGNTCKCHISVVQTTKNKRCNQRLDHGSGHWTATCTELTQDWKTGRHRSCDVGLHRDVRINKNSEISNDGRRNHEVSADSKRVPRKLVEATTCRIFDEFSCRRFERSHPATSSMHAEMRICSLGMADGRQEP